MSNRRSSKLGVTQARRAIAPENSSDSCPATPAGEAELPCTRAATADAEHEPRTALFNDEKRLAGLVRTIEGEIVPRLLMSMVVSTQAASCVRAPRPVPAPTPRRDAAVEFARLLLEDDRAAAAAYVQIARQRGTPLERIYLDLLAPAARHLGEFWEKDQCDFKALTAGFTRLLSMLREVGGAQH